MVDGAEVQPKYLILRRRRNTTDRGERRQKGDDDGIVVGRDQERLLVPKRIGV